jgi:hypothetical protein
MRKLAELTLLLLPGAYIVWQLRKITAKNAGDLPSPLKKLHNLVLCFAVMYTLPSLYKFIHVMRRLLYFSPAIPEGAGGHHSLIYPLAYVVALVSGIGVWTACFGLARRKAEVVARFYCLWIIYCASFGYLLMESLEDRYSYPFVWAFILTCAAIVSLLPIVFYSLPVVRERLLNCRQIALP